MTILPAIDLKQGKCVRLKQGRATEVTVYSDDPVFMAKHWESEGARYLHIVDLDGAFTGHSVHGEIIARMVEALSIPVEVGGGLRTDDDIARMLACGVDRVVLGTRAWDRTAELQRVVDRFGGRIAVGLDARNGQIQIKGWTETTEAHALEFARRMDRMGVQTLIYTDTARDGMMDGVSTAPVKAVCEAVGCSVIASGGVADVADVKRLEELKQGNLIGVIIGKALYEERITLKELQGPTSA